MYKVSQVSLTNFIVSRELDMLSLRLSYISPMSIYKDPIFPRKCIKEGFLPRMDISRYNAWIWTRLLPCWMRLCRPSEPSSSICAIDYGLIPGLIPGLGFLSGPVVFIIIQPQFYYYPYQITPIRQSPKCFQITSKLLIETDLNYTLKVTIKTTAMALSLLSNK